MDGIEWAASAMVAARTRLEIASDNLANVSTNGYRRVEARGFLGALGVSIARERGPSGALVAGNLRESSVNAVSEMIDVLAAERSFESAEKAVTAIDTTRQKSAETARIK
jgi:flagellar basal body rod protein FlgG